MSLAETRQIILDIQEIMQMLNRVEVKNNKINADIPRTREALRTFRDLERVSLRYLALSRRFGFSDNMQNAIQTVTAMITAIRMLQISLAMIGGGTPFGLFMGLASIGLAGMTIYDSIEGY